jgi:flagellin
MSIGIQNNAMTQVKRHEAAKQTASARLASGQQINKASQGAAELSASTSLKATLKAASAGLSNATRGSALGQTADGAMGEISGLLERMKEISVASASDTFGTTDRAASNAEMTTLATQIENIATRTRYAGSALLDGTIGQVDIQTGENAADTTFFTPTDVKASTLGIDALDISTKQGAIDAQAVIDTAIATLAAARANVGAFMVGLETTVNVNQVKIENLEAAVSVFTDADLAKEATNLAMADIRGQMAQSMITKENQAASNITGLVR